MVNEMLESLMVKMMADLHEIHSETYRKMMYIYEDAMVHHREKAEEYKQQYKGLMGQRVSH